MAIRVAAPLMAAAGLGLLAVAPVQAGTGDVHVVTAEKLNVRSGPSNGDTVRTQVESGSKVIELKRDGGWIGVRVLETGEEGWVFGRYTTPVVKSTLEGGVDADGPFAGISTAFDNAVAHVNRQLGHETVAEAVVDGNTLTIHPTEAWLTRGGHGSHLMGTLAFYEVWKNHNDHAAVRVVMLDGDGEAYVTIDDTEDGPILEASSRAPKG